MHAAIRVRGDANKWNFKTASSLSRKSAPLNVPDFNERTHVWRADRDCQKIRRYSSKSPSAARALLSGKRLCERLFNYRFMVLVGLLSYHSEATLG